MNRALVFATMNLYHLQPTASRSHKAIFQWHWCEEWGKGKAKSLLSLVSYRACAGISVPLISMACGFGHAEKVAWLFRFTAEIAAMKLGA